MSNTQTAPTYIGRRAKNLDNAPAFDGVSKIVIQVNDEMEIVSGSDTGRTVTIVCPWGTQEMADNLLADMRGYQYQPLQADGALLDPASELGDAVTVKDTYGGIWTKKTYFDSGMTADVSAPYEQEIDHEYPYKPEQERKVTRQFKNVRAELLVQADRIAAEVEARIDDIQKVNAVLEVQAGEISAKVSKTGGSSSSFGWSMTDTEQVWKANNKEIFRLDKNGAKVSGEIEALTGKIGGLAIMSNYLSYNNQTWGGTNSTGLYLGPNGIQLGKNFSVDSSGNLHAATGTFDGYVKAGNINYGGDAGYFSGSGLSSGSVYGNRLAANTVTTAYTSSGINTSLSYADYAYSCVQGWKKITALDTGSLNTSDFTISNHQIDLSTITYMNSSGGTSRAKVLIWS